MDYILVNIGFFSENAYIVFDKETKRGLVIDPGGEVEKLLSVIEENGLEIEGILLTHGHFDHTGALNALKDAKGILARAHKDERQVIENHRASHVARGREARIDSYFEDGEIIEAGSLKLRVIHTPGHTSGSCCFYNEECGVLFSGDTLFKESVGRTDFPTGNYEALSSSIKDKLYALPDETIVLPGHGAASTIAHEKANNPFTR